MKKSLGVVFTFITGWIFVILLLVFFIQFRDSYGPNPILKRRVGIVEAFQAESRISETPDRTIKGVNPGDPGLGNPREPYSLLKGWLPLASEPTYMNAASCRAADFQTRLEPTGNFRQLTNNYKRGDPDSCSGPIQDLTFAIYKSDPIPDTGCIDK